MLQQARGGGRGRAGASCAGYHPPRGAPCWRLHPV